MARYRFASTRTGILAVSLLAVMLLFVARLFYLQVIRHDEYTAMAQRSQQRSFVLPAERGKIFMMDGRTPVPVVLNRAVYTVIADPHVVKPEQRSAIVAALRETAGGEMVKDAAERLGKEKSRYEVLARSITRAQAEQLRKHQFEGILLQPGAMRNYPEGQLAAQLLGFVNADGKGQYGVEERLDERLRGRDGLLRSVTDVRNVPLTVGKNNVRIEPQSGETVVLSIDRNIQHYAEEALRRGIERSQATQGNVLVMEPSSGKVLAMANYPTFAPAEFAKQQDPAVFVNATTSLPYEPGSIVKTFTMAVGIDKGVISPQSTYQNSDCTQVGDRQICNVIRGRAGTTTMQQALTNSYNVGTVMVGRQLGDGAHINGQARRIIHEYFYQKFGFGQKTGIELPEVAGIVRGPDAGDGDEVRYANMTFGQGMNVTSIQLAAAFCSVVNGGQYYRPTVVAGTLQSGALTPATSSPIRRTVSPETSTAVRQMLQVARRSTAAGWHDKQGYGVGGKTGTAELLVDGAYNKRDTAATYIGYGGTETPKYVIMVYVAAPGKRVSLEGGTHAAPIFTDISNWMISYLNLAPRS